MFARRCYRVSFAGSDRAAVSRIAGNADLGTDVAVAFVHESADALLNLLQHGAAGVSIQVHGFAALAAEQLVHRHSGPLAENVPQGHVHAADGVAQHRAVAPYDDDERRLPDVLDLQRIFAEEERLEVLVHSRFDDPRPLGEGGAAESVQARLAGHHLDRRPDEFAPAR